MAVPAVRRADFLMALAYATDLATGHSRDFALRSCVLAMRFAERREVSTRKRAAASFIRRCCATSDAMPTRICWRTRGATRSPCAGSLHHIDMGNRAEFVEVFVRAITRKFAGASPEELAKAVERGLAQGPQVNIPILSGHCEVAQRIAERIGLPEQIRENLGQIYERWDGKGLPRGLSGECGEVSGPAGDAGAGCNRAERSSWIRDHEGDDRQARRRRLRAGARRSFPRACRDVARGARRARRPRDDPGARARAARDAQRGGGRRSLSGDRRHDRHADAVHLRPFARGRGAGRCGGASNWVFRPPTFATFAGPPTHTTSANWRFRSRHGCAPAR